MNRRNLLQMSAALGVGVSLSRTALAAAKTGGPAAGGAPTPVNPLRVPADGVIPVAFLLSEGAVLIDFTGPWEAFLSVHVNAPVSHPFRPYTVSETTDPLHVGGGLTVIPHYSITSAPAPKVVVIPAQNEPTEPVLNWLRTTAKTADLIMSVCTGAFVLARTGLLSGKEATTHHSAFGEFAMAFPDIRLKRGARFVDLGNLATAGGLSSGIDLALHVVERYFGRTVASDSAYYLEYQGQGWMDPNSNQAYAQARVSSDEHPLCPVCEMDVDKASAPSSTYQGKTYYFCEQEHKALFDTSPQRFTAA
jgi:transcriptional regulator GlxA family with amidase domain